MVSDVINHVHGPSNSVFGELYTPSPRHYTVHLPLPSGRSSISSVISFIINE